VGEIYDGYALEARVAELERKVEYLMQRVAAATPVPMAKTGGGFSPAVLALVQQGNKIGAIKQYREETGLGLREAKDAIDSLG
jgi:large subunit ribosomal protein L7/L12